MIAYLELIGGVSGNMLLGALIDAGCDQAQLEATLRTIPVDGWSIERRRVHKLGIAATYFDFVIPGEDHHGAAERLSSGRSAAGRRLEDVLALVDRSGLSTSQKMRARTVYVRLAEAEAHVHGTTVEAIHFHEVGATDAILDVAGACIAFDALEVERIFCSSFPLGRGTVSMHHGRYPNPPPATAELLRGAPTFDAGIEGELVTTTGAAILTTLVESAGTRPPMVGRKIGYGAGRSDFPIPNVLRATIGELAGEDSSGATEVAVLEATIDDMQPQHFELALERVLAAGAYDAWLSPVTMKKSRPAVLFGAIAPLDSEAEVARTILSETTTLGVRVRHDRRYRLERSLAHVETPLGWVRVKTALIDGGARRTLEYDDVVRIARELDRPVGEIAHRLEEMIPRS